MPLSAFVISSKSEKSFSFAVKKECGRAASGKHPAPSESEERCFMQAVPCMKMNTANEKDPSTALGMTIRDNAHPARLSSRCDANLRPFGAPPSKGRRENAASRTPHEDGLRYENTVPPHSSFRAKARNLFRSREGKGCERSSKRAPPAPCAPKKRCFMQTVHAGKGTRQTKKIPRLRSG